jgi:hypothetical protein
MIIKMYQSKANIKQEFEIYYNDVFKYTGKQSALSSACPNMLCKLDNTIPFKSRVNKKTYLINLIRELSYSFCILFLWQTFKNIWIILLVLLSHRLIPYVAHEHAVFDGTGQKVARFRMIRKPFLTNSYRMDFAGKDYRLYIYCRSHYKYISVYLDEVQIAQINKNLHTEDNKDNYMLYLLDEEAAAADLLTMFTLYYDSYNHTTRGAVELGKKWQWSWTIGPMNRFYNKDWLPAHFPKSKRMEGSL